MNMLSNRTFIQAGTLAFVAYLAWFGWVHLSPRKPEVVPLRKQVADQIVPQVVDDLKYQREISPVVLSTAVVHEQVKSIRAAQRVLGWLVIVPLLWTVFTITFIRAMVRKESNRVNAFTLTVYAVVDALLAYLLLGAALTGWLSVLLFIVAVGAALAYNFRVMNFALRLET